ncbi:thiol reductant ABC exporter subunit CydD [Plantibacter cousiniae (nom. nud.)]|uniref:ATP-binding cassette, subfamily C, CydD n=1 Tax=Plantibacter cousiniae (nom. nud.) TaxID=199709 RepID=A0ABY1LLA1_9MICO|nr:thiol reductant ABC exporter subunit CydD [Plantibacter cousiniae]SKC56368.1 ATP-binding cassette, subfamily C, CydD [Plantibacter cousiniae]
MRPLDPRLLRYARGARSVLGLGAVIALVQTACTLGFAWFVAQLVSRSIAGDPVEELLPSLWLLIGIVVLRAGAVLASDSVNARGSAIVRSQLRRALAGAFETLGPGWVSRRSSAALTTVAGRGLDALDAYFGRYVPQLILTAIAMPIIAAVIFIQDPLSGITVIVTLPLIPVFMILIGFATQAVQRRQWETLAHLSRGFLELVAGMATLKLFGRQHRQVQRVRTVTEEYRVETMKVLRFSFVSGFALELLSSLAVAVVAVGIGLRLLDGSLLLGTGLFVLILAPEAFLPLRNVGANYHAAAEGVTAADEVFEILDEAKAVRESPSVPDQLGAPATAGDSVRRTSGLVLDGLGVQYDELRVLDDLDATFPAGVVTAVVGASGAGKTSMASAILGFVDATGSILHDGGRMSPTPGGRRWLSWAPQRPVLIAGTVGSNVALGDDAPDEVLIVEALSALGLSALPLGHPIGAVGDGVSGGQAQRIAIARALYRLRRTPADAGTPVLLLDEPSSALDAASEALVIDAARDAARAGAAVIVITHRPSIVEHADAVLEIRVRSERVQDDEVMLHG